MNYKQLVLVLMLLVSTLAPIQGVYADEGSETVETQAAVEIHDEPLRAAIEGNPGYRDERFREQYDRGPQMKQEFMMRQGGHPGEGMRFETHSEGEGFMGPPVADFQHMDPVEMIINAMFQQAGNINPVEYMQLCDTPEAMVDKAIEALKAEGAWNDKSVCSKLEEESVYCKKRSNQCESILKFGGPRFDTEKISCDELTEEKVFDLCIAQRTKHSPQMKDTCEAEWKVREFECSRQQQRKDPFCEKDQVIADEKRRGEGDCSHFIRTTETTNEDGTVTQQEDRSEYDSCMAKYDGESAWAARQELCETRNQGGMDCGKDTFLEECRSRNSQFTEENTERMEFECKQQAADMYFGFSRGCAEQKTHYDRCIQQTGKMCTFFDSAVQKCNAVTEEELRTAMVAQAARMCKFKQYESGEDGLQLRGKDVSALVKQMRALRAKAGLTEGAVLDEQTEGIVEVAETVEDVEDKGIGYKLKWLVGAAAKSEKEDAVLLGKQAERLEATIATLEALVGQVTDETTKAALSAQIEVLKGQMTDIEELAEKKQKRSKGLFSFLFG